MDVMASCHQVTDSPLTCLSSSHPLSDGGRQRRTHMSRNRVVHLNHAMHGHCLSREKMINDWRWPSVTEMTQMGWALDWRLCFCFLKVKLLKSWYVWKSRLMTWGVSSLESHALYWSAAVGRRACQNEEAFDQSKNPCFWLSDSSRWKAVFLNLYKL